LDIAEAFMTSSAFSAFGSDILAGRVFLQRGTRIGGRVLSVIDDGLCITIGIYPAI
jgi:hypothetical protein